MKTAHDLVAAAKAQIHEISIDDAEQALQQADLLLDVREPEEYRAGHIPGAVNVPRGLLEFQIGSLPEMDARERNILLYCKTSGRAALSAASLHEMGYLNVTSIAGGFDAWLAAGKAVAKPQVPEFE